MCRRYRMLPCVSCHRLLAVCGSIEPSSVADSSAVVSSGDNGERSTRSNSPSFQSSCIATGISSSSRIVSSTFATPRCTTWSRTNIDRSSRRCGSSTPTRTRPADDAAVSESITPHTSCRLSSPTNPGHDASAPSGMPRPHDVPTTQRTSQPPAAAPTRVSRAIRLFPTPAEPLITTPDASGSASAASMSRISSPRPTNGHVNRMHPSVKEQVGGARANRET